MRTVLVRWCVAVLAWPLGVQFRPRAGARRIDLPWSVRIIELEAGLTPRARLVPLTGLEEE